MRAHLLAAAAKDEGAADGWVAMGELLGAASGSLVGRTEELSRCRALLAAGPRPLLTLWGSAGIGKTRLAHELAITSTAQFDGGITFSSLAECRRSDELLAVVAGSLEMTLASSRTSPDGLRRIGRALATRGKTLVVLDDVERVIGPVAQALGIWRRLAPEAAFVVTSRELLDVPDEIPLELSPLSLPRDGTAAFESEAVRLLVDRASTLVPGFRASPRVLADIATRLEGIPLAIELAAGLLAVMGAEELRDRLARRFEILSVHHGGFTPRQRSLRSALDGSWDLLDSVERGALAEVSVFRGGFDIAAAEAVLTTSSDAPQVATIVASLRHKSLLMAVGEPGDRPRLGVLETVREYAAEKLGARRGELEDRHAAYYVEQAEGAPLPWLPRERDNLLAVLDRFLESPSARRAELALRALVPLGKIFSTSGAVATIANLGARAIAEARSFALDPVRLMGALEAFGGAAMALGQLAEAADTLREAYALAGSRGGVEQARVANSLGGVLQAQGLTDEALRLHEEALALTKAGGAPAEQARSLAAVGLLRHVTDDFARARDLYEQALDLYRDLGNPPDEARVRARLGFLLQDLGDSEGALAVYEEALTNLGPLRGGAMEGNLLAYRGIVLRSQGRFDEAHDAFDRAITLMGRAGDRRFEGAFLMDRGIALLLEGKLQEALRALEQARSVTADVGDPKVDALIAGYTAVTLGRLGDDAGAAAALDEAARAARAADPPARALLPVHEAHVALLRAKMHGSARARAEAASFTRARVRETTIRGEHARVTMELLRQTLDAMDPPVDALVISTSRSRARPPGGEWIDVSSRPALARVLRALTEARLRAPGEPVTPLDLVRAGWPEERILARAGTNRLRVLVATLRAEGLRDLLRNERGGYLLDPDVRLVVGDPPAD